MEDVIFSYIQQIILQTAINADYIQEEQNYDEQYRYDANVSEHDAGTDANDDGYDGQYDE
jgi:hypothetical protein